MRNANDNENMGNAKSILYQSQSQFGILVDDHMVKEVRIASDGEHSSEEESEDEETAGKVVTKAGVEV